MKKNVLFLAMMLFVALSGYPQLKVTLLEPEPNVAVQTYKEKICIEFDEKIQDDFTLSKEKATYKTKVTQWKESLKNGFVNGFGTSFTIVDDASEADLILKIAKADIGWDLVSTHTTVYGSGGGVNSSTSGTIQSKITFKALLMDKNREILKQCAHTSVAKKAASNRKAVNPNVASAMESMYEIIAKEFFE